MTKIWNNRNMELHCGKGKNDKVYYRIRIFNKRDDGEYEQANSFQDIESIKALYEAAAGYKLE